MIDPLVVGYIATVLSVVAFVPQVVKSVRTKSTNDLSLGMYIVFTASQVFWFAYGVMLLAWPIMVANAINFVLASIILIHKIKYK